MYEVRTGSDFAFASASHFSPVEVEAIRLKEARRTRHPLAVPGPRDLSRMPSL